MGQKKVLILDGHPAETSLSRQFALAYLEGARSKGHEVRIIHLRDLEFDPDNGYGGYTKRKPLEPQLEEFLTTLEWCDHFVLTSPMWWGSLPAKLKGLIDRSFLPGRVFAPNGDKLPDRLLAGRSAQVILTSDSPWWYFRFWLNRPFLWQLKRQILGFVGFSPVRVTHFSQASHPSDAQINKWVAKAHGFGARLA